MERKLEGSEAAFAAILAAIEADKADRRKTRRISIVCAAVCVAALILFAGVLGVLAAGVQAGDGAQYYADGAEGGV